MSKSGASHIGGRLIVHPRLKPHSAALSNKRERKVPSSGASLLSVPDFGEFLVQWVACVREIAARSEAEAIIRFGLSKEEVSFLTTATWIELMEILRGRGSFTIEVQPSNQLRAG